MAERQTKKHANKGKKSITLPVHSVFRMLVEHGPVSTVNDKTAKDVVDVEVFNLAERQTKAHPNKGKEKQESTDE